MTALFELDGDLAVPTDYARGPWDPGALHGGPVGALVARSIEATLSDGADLQVARITLELLRPVPVAPLAVTAEVTRGGRKVQIVEAAVTDAASGTEVARARALRIRRAELELPPDRAEPSVRVPPLLPEQSRLERSVTSADYVAFHNAGSEHRFASGTWAEPGPVVVWIRLAVPVVAGEEPTPLQRVMAAADFGNGVSRVLSWDEYVFINPDLTVHLVRPAAGEWIGLDAATTLGPAGAGLAESTLHDHDGPIGRALQSLFVDRR